MTNIKQRRFAVLPVLLALLVVVAIGAAGYHFIYSVKKAESPVTPSVATSVTQSPQSPSSSEVSVSSKPTCTMSVSKKTPDVGEPVTISWTSKNADFASIVAPDLLAKVPVAGTRYAVTGSTNISFDEYGGGFALYFYGKEGTTKCDTYLAGPLGLTKQIYQFPSFVLLEPGNTARSIDGRFSIKLLNIDVKNFYSPTLVVNTPNTKDIELQFIPEKDGKKTVGIYEIRLCEVASSTDHPNGQVDLVITDNGKDPECEIYEG